MINFRIIFRTLGILLILTSFFMPVGTVFSFFYGDNDIYAIFIASFITFVSGLTLWVVSGFRKNSEKEDLRKREGYLIVSLAWILIPAFGALPYVIHGSIPSYTDAFFESMSGFTTTGASVLTNVDPLPHGILFWRSMTHWLGGMGIIVLSLAILPLLGVGGAQLFEAEVSGPTKEKIHPQVQGTAKRLWGIYATLTIIETLFLMAGGMPFFDSLCHSFGTLASGGFSIKQDSIAYYPSSYIHWVITIFMFLAGTNFTLHYHAFHGKWRAYFKDEEFRFYTGIVLFFILIVALSIYLNTNANLEKSIRDASFQVISIITSTGFITADYEKWTPYSGFIFLVLLFFGGCVGSTSGGIKMMRLLLLFKNGIFELKRLIHPSAVVPIRLNARIVPNRVINNILAFFVFYILTFMTGSLLLNFTGLDILSSMGGVATCLGGVGPGLNKVGPVGTFHDVSFLGKWILSLCMLLGRLEIFTFMVIFTPYYWKA